MPRTPNTITSIDASTLGAGFFFFNSHLALYIYSHDDSRVKRSLIGSKRGRPASATLLIFFLCVHIHSARKMWPWGTFSPLPMASGSEYIQFLFLFLSRGWKPKKRSARVLHRTDGRAGREAHSFRIGGGITGAVCSVI
ncbi:hypothetical protein LX36DRAFT_406605 [Colletotrichum falcatum]|nr:hypothetical protein LX36DRAFT_406605 [Colletotrichum falcatum]